MENLVDSEFWHEKRVLITGHSGFKGVWLTHWLGKYTNYVAGFSLPINEKNYMYRRTSLGQSLYKEYLGDIRDFNLVKSVLREFNPDVVFHLAAQALVDVSHNDPLHTLSTNVMGTANLLEAIRQTSINPTVINVTSDKCYEPRVGMFCFNEHDKLGGDDPYSASKACSEIITHAYRSSFSNMGANFRLATARAGNVIGGGDKANRRLVPDLLRAFDAGSAIKLRSANATRPWQHVLDPLQGYIKLAEKLSVANRDIASAWNFSPTGEVKTVADLAATFVKLLVLLMLNREIKICPMRR